MTPKLQINGEDYRNEELDGREYVVADATIVQAMPLNGGYVPRVELQKSAPAWNGTPITLSHPTDDDGRPVIANSPEVAESAWFGRLFNVQAENDGDRLDGEMWFDVQKAENVGEKAVETVESVKNGETIDVSTAYFADELDPGVYDGQRRDEVVGNLRPDHLAALPDEKGKCSVEDGCGVPSPNSLYLSGERPDDPVESGEDVPNANNMEAFRRTFHDVLRTFFPESKPNEPAESGAVNANSEMSDKSRNEMIAYLVENHEFTEDSLDGMGDNCLERTYNSFKEEQGDDDNDPEANSGDDDDTGNVDELADQIMNRVEDQMEERFNELERDLQSEERESHIKVISENTDFDRETLEEKPTDELETLANALSDSKADYSGRVAGGPGSSDNDLDKWENTVAEARGDD